MQKNLGNCEFRRVIDQHPHFDSNPKNVVLIRN